MVSNASESAPGVMGGRPSAAASAPRVRQAGPAPPLHEDVSGVLSPLLSALAAVFGRSPLCLFVPQVLVSEASRREEWAALCVEPDQTEGTSAEQLAYAVLPTLDALPEAGGPLYVPLTPELAASGWATAAAWPIRVDGDDLGALAVLDSRTNGPSGARRRAAEVFVKAVSASLRAAIAQKQRARASAALLEVSWTAGSTLHLDEVLDLVTERTAKLVGADRCGLWLLGKDGATLQPSALYGMPREFVQRWKRDSLPLEKEPLSREAVLTREPILIPDAPNDPRTDKAAVQFFGDKTILVLPLIAKGQTLGSLFINHVRIHHRYSKSEIDTAAAIASQAAIAIQNARLYSEVQRWSSQLEQLQAIMSKLSRSRSVSSIAGIVADELRHLIRYDNCRVLLLREDTNELVPLAVVSSAHEYPVETLEALRIPIGQGITGHVALTGEPLIVGDAAKDPRAYYIPGTAEVDESMVAAPINFEGRVIGVITLSRLGLNQFSEDDLRLLNIFVSEAAIEFENARLYQETQKKSRELLASFHRVGDALAAGLDPNETLHIIVELAAEMVRAEACAILLVDEASGELVFRAGTRGLHVDLREAGRVPGGDWLGRQVVMEGVPKLSPDLAEQERPPWLTAPGADSLRSFLGVPLVLRGKPIGVLGVFGRRPGQFSQAEVELLSSFAHQAAIAIRNAQLFTSLQERVRELTGLAEVSQSIATLSNLDDTYAELTKAIAQLLHAESCVILLAQPDGHLSPQHPAHGLTPDELSKMRFRVDRGDSPPEAICPVRSVEGFSVTCEGPAPDRPWLVAPMRAQDQLVGGVLVGGRAVATFNENDLRLLVILAGNAAVIVQNAVLYQSVESERDELDAIISNTSDAIIIIDQENRVSRVNAAAELLTGWQASEVVGRPCEEYVASHLQAAGEDGAGSPALLDIILKREPVPYFETSVMTKEGNKRDIAASYSVVRGAGRSNVLGVVIARDMSRQREVERMKSEFVSMVSHELRTPLGLIKGYASTLVNPELSIEEATARRFLLGIDGAADRLAKLIENLLSVSRIESGLFRLSTQQIDLSLVVSNALTTARSAAKGHNFALKAPRKPVMVEGDRVQLELVMDNLLGNAVKYSPAGKTVAVEVRRREHEAEVQVRDEGIGIAPQHLPRVFDKFYRVEGGYSRRTPGSGLGLYICKSIIEAHGGRIWAESTPRAGSTFRFTLPLSGGRQEDLSQVAVTEEVTTGAQGQNSGS